MKQRSKKAQKKSNTAIKIILIIVFVLAAAVFCVAGYKLLSAMNKYDEAKDAYEDIRSNFYDASSTKRPSSKEKESESETLDPDDLDDGFVWDFSKLLEINPEGVGYIRMRGGGDNIIDFPIVQGTDNAYYLDHMFDGTVNNAGAIFMDCYARDGFDSRYCIIYGHNMKSGSRMFSCLKNYKDPEYFAAHPEIDIYAGEKHYVYKVFAQFQTTTDSFVYANIYPDDETLLSMIWQGLESSAIDAGIPWEYFSADSHVITLSTCTDQYDSHLRDVVMLVRDREVVSK